MTGLLLLLFAIVAGAFLPAQAGVNGRLAQFVGSPVVVLVFYRSEDHRASAAPWWAWLGGLFGAFFVTSTVVVPVRIGAAAFFGILVAAQLITSVVLDRFGWIGFPQRDVSPLKLVGVALLVAGALLVRLA
jgi:transporter family-2 protein